jgi:glycosyltransferase involved in cell wall biosynthesis
MITVVIPLYNKAHTIINTLSSVLTQSYTDFEIVIINDGSTDNGVEVIKNFSQDSRIKVIEQDNQGVSVARNNGVINAKFDYIAFLDGDDEWKSDYLSMMKEAIDKFPMSGMFCSAGIVRNADGSEVLRLAKKYEFKIVEIEFFDNPHIFMHTSATVVKKTDFNKTVGFPVGMKRNEDFALFFSLALITPVIYCGFPLSIYVGGIEGQATSVGMDKFLDHIIKRHNLVFENWFKRNNKNESFIIFMKYELRHIFMINSIDNKLEINRYYLDNLNPELLKYFSHLEKFLFKNILLRRVSVLYTLCTKIRWRMRGFPRVNG